MGPKDVIRYLMDTNDYVLTAFLADLSDDEFLMRPASGANHVAWQLGHLIESEQDMLKTIPGTKPMDLPAEWAGVHASENAAVDPPKGFASKAQYLELYSKSRDHIRKQLEAYPEADFDKPTPGKMAEIAPKLGDMFTLIADHPMMHVGQFAVLRRKLGKPRVM